MCPRQYIYETKKVLSFYELDKILNQVKVAQRKKEVSEKVIFIIAMFGEPLLDNLFFEKVEHIKFIFPESDILVYTNGILISKFKEKILNDKCITELIYSDYGDNEKEFESITQIKLNPEFFKQMKNDIIEIAKVKNVRYWKAWREGKLYNFSSRAGSVKDIKLKEKINGCLWNRLEHLSILSNGDLILCCMDWKRETNYDNFLKDDFDLIECLQGEGFKDMTEKVNGIKESDKFFICKRCEYSR